MTYRILASTNTFLELVSCDKRSFHQHSHTARHCASRFHLIAISSSLWGRGTTIALYTVNAVGRHANGIALVNKRPSFNVKTSDSRRDS